MNADLRESNIALARSFLEAINRWDFVKIRKLLAADITFEMPYAPGGFETRTDGFDNVMTFLETIPRDVVDGSENLHEINIDTFGSDPNELLAEYKSNMKLAPTGATYTNTYVTRFSIRDGKIKRYAEYFDPIRLLVALGGKIEMPTAR